MDRLILVCNCHRLIMTGTVSSKGGLYLPEMTYFCTKLCTLTFMFNIKGFKLERRVSGVTRRMMALLKLTIHFLVHTFTDFFSW